MKVLVTGGRDYDNWQRVHSILDALHARYGITQIIHGAARGADFHAKTWAQNNGVEETGNTWKPNWNEHGKSAGIQRNILMFYGTSPHLVVAFPGGSGTKHMQNLAAECETPTLCIPDPTYISQIDAERVFSVFGDEDEIINDMLEMKAQEPTEPYWLFKPTDTQRWSRKSAATPADRYLDEAMF